MRKILKIFSFYIYPLFLAATYVILSINQGHFISMFLLIALAWHLAFTVIQKTVGMSANHYIIVSVIKIFPVIAVMIFYFVFCMIVAGLGYYPAALIAWAVTAVSAVPAYLYDITILSHKKKEI